MTGRVLLVGVAHTMDDRELALSAVDMDCLCGGSNQWPEGMVTERVGAS